jgi:hypothetical protein
MLLGVYWYYGFPKGLYYFDFFAYRPGIGGSSGGPAELTATVQAPDPTALLAAVQAVAARYPQVPLLAQAHGPLLRLKLDDWALPDYVFFVATELEALLQQQQATLTTEPLPADAPLLRLADPQDPTPPYHYGDGLVQAVSSRGGKYQSEVALLRVDCHLPLTQKAGFLAALEGLCEQFGLDVLYYLDRNIPPQVNLMVFFGNGRQGVGGQPLRYTDTAALTAAVVTALSAYGAQAGHLGGYPADYPRRGPHILRMADADFVR